MRGEHELDPREQYVAEEEKITGIKRKKGMKYMMYGDRVPGSNSRSLLLLRLCPSRAGTAVGRGVTECSPLKPVSKDIIVLLASV